MESLKAHSELSNLWLKTKNAKIHLNLRELKELSLRGFTLIHGKKVWGGCEKFIGQSVLYLIVT